MRVLIIGGGIGGLTAAIALQRAGFEAHVFEQMRELGEVGAGVSLGPNAVRVLDGLGFGEALVKVGLITDFQQRRDWKSGEILERNVTGDTLRQQFGFPNYHVHRADLHEVVREGLDESHVTLSARCVAVEERDGGVITRFADGSTAEGDLLVGADGAGSVIRDYVTGPDSPVGPSKVAWRGLARGDVGRELGLELSTHSFNGEGKFFLAYYIGMGKYVNWIGILDQAGSLRELPRFEVGEKEAALADYGHWAPQVRRLIESTDVVSKWVLYDSAPLSAWTRGRVTLLGDAAHPMLPFAAQGAAQAIEDGVILARCLERQLQPRGLGKVSPTQNDIDAALASYFRMRFDRASAAQGRGTASGATMAQRGRNDRPEVPPRDWLFQYDALNVPLGA